MQRKTGALRPGKLGAPTFQILDLCMAPGAFTISALNYNPGSFAYGITLPTKDGGHELQIKSTKVLVKELDVTMLATEFSCETIPESHPDRDLFLTEQPFADQRFQLILCDGQVLRSTLHRRSEHREAFEARRLADSQLILALHRIMPGGTIVILLHKAEACDTIDLLQQFKSFSEIELFKPIKHHAIKSSLYLVAKNVQPHAEAAQAALKEWKEDWYRSTFGGEKGTGEKLKYEKIERMQEILDEFGGRLIEMAEPLWEIQADALAAKDFTRDVEEAPDSVSTTATPPASKRYVPPHKR